MWGVQIWCATAAYATIAGPGSPVKSNSNAQLSPDEVEKLSKELEVWDDYWLVFT